MDSKNYLVKIIEKRRKRVSNEGHALGETIPSERRIPPVPFIRDPFLICEIKRKSPSKGNISLELNHLDQAGLYGREGVQSVSVLTEQDHFAGSLADLTGIKEKFPHLAVLRKDFLLDKKDIDVSYLCGADAVLLIAAALSGKELREMYQYAKSLGLEALVEVHSPDDVKKAAGAAPVLTGINCRDLETFRIDLAHPLSLRNLIDWETTLLFESGIHSQEQALFALSSGFNGILTGESVVRNPGLIKQYLTAFSLQKCDFWQRLYARKKPFVKICGITREEDARHAVDCGADIIGYNFTESKRRVDPALPEKLRDLPVLKAGIVVAGNGKGLDPDAKRLLEKGILDVIQFHGSEKPDECYKMAFPYYKAMRIKDGSDIESMGLYRCPRILADAYSENAFGGTGIRIAGELVSGIREKHALWIAGGIGPENIREILDRYKPELVDACSKLETSPGIKDHARVAQFIKEIKSETVL
ncbi:MAG: bifunctional indole-3-glycerol phosphate synthase/phosphoribosylanthranilate isomerase [Spirochaetales bacterium]|nr:bifunctional indole-3-glycerol phosphate synthase/phosphoribosylanthranilate isomerase [Spirochaetales bacterium]